MSVYGLQPIDREDTVLTILKETSLSKIKKEDFGLCGHMKARRTYDYFSSEDWIFERLIEGVRVFVKIKDGKVLLYSMKGEDIGNSFPEIVLELDEVEVENAIFDGVITSMKSGNEDMDSLSQRKRIKDFNKALESEIDIQLYLFDCISFDGYDLRELQLRDRKKILKYSMEWEFPVNFVNHRNTEGKELLKEAIKKGWKGVVARKADSIYESRKSSLWKTFVC